MPGEPQPRSSKDHLCTTCLSVCSPVGGLGVVLGGAAIGIAILAALTTHDGNVALATTPIAIGGLAGVLRSAQVCPKCRSRALIPLSTPRAQTLIREALRDLETGS